MKHKLLCCLVVIALSVSLFSGQKASAVTSLLRNKTITEGGYNFEHKGISGASNMSLGDNGTFSCTWSGTKDAFFRAGKTIASEVNWKELGKLTYDYACEGTLNGYTYLGVSGWTKSPLVEYFIVESWGTTRPLISGLKGAVTIDGGIYDIYETTCENTESIEGKTTFKQYWSVRRTKSQSGTISINQHFAAWEALGMKLGNIHETSFMIHADNYGTASVKKNVFKMESEKPISTGKGITPSGKGSGVSDDFEGTGTDWSGRGDVTLLLSDTFKHGGNRSLYVSDREASWNGLMAASPELIAGEKYLIDLYIGYIDKNVSTTNFTFGIQYDSEGMTVYQNVVENYSVNKDEWQNMKAEFEIPEDAENISLYLETSYTETPSEKDLIGFFLDDVKLVKKEIESKPDNKPIKNTEPIGMPDLSTGALKDAFNGYFKVGTSVSAAELGLGASFVKKHFNSITPENELKPEAILDQLACQQYGNNVNTQVKFENGARQILKFCSDNGISLRGYTFVWYSQTPDWFFRENFVSNDSYVSKEIMDQRLESFIKNTFALLKSSYPNLDVYSYDVCTEIFSNSGGGIRTADISNWTRIYGDDSFVFKAFEYARKYAPEGCKLFLSDYNEYVPAKTNDIYNMVMRLKEKGLIDGIGMQSHLDVSYPSASEYKTALDKFLSTGLEVQLTELDITCEDPSAQAKLYADIFQMCIDHAHQIGAVTVWGTHDSISWRSSLSPLLFGENYTPKEAYTAVMKCSPANDAVMKGCTLSLNGNIGVNCYMELSETLANDEEAYVLFTLPNGSTKKAFVKDAVQNTTVNIGKTYHVFSCEVASYEMTQQFKAQMISGSKHGGTQYSYSVRDYAKYIIDQKEKYSQDDVSFCKALLNYGASAQSFFEVATENPANDCLSASDSTVPILSKDNLASYKKTKVSNELLGSFTGCNMVLKSETTFKMYFQPVESLDIDKLTFQIDGKTITPTQSGESYVMTVPNVKAWNLSKEYCFTVSDGTETISILCGPMTYCYNVLDGTYPETLKKLVSALYIYQQKSEIYK